MIERLRKEWHQFVVLTDIETGMSHKLPRWVIWPIRLVVGYIWLCVYLMLGGFFAVLYVCVVLPMDIWNAIKRRVTA